MYIIRIKSQTFPTCQKAAEALSLNLCSFHKTGAFLTAKAVKTQQKHSHTAVQSEEVRLNHAAEI